MNLRASLLLLLGLVVAFSRAQDQDVVPPYVKQCRPKDPKFIDCIIGAVHHLKPYLAEGIPEIQMPSVEPFVIDELSLSLTSGPNGYKISLKDLEIFNTSNFTVEKLTLGSPFEARLRFPHLKISARYTSSGVLIILPASGNGEFSADFTDVEAVVRAKMGTQRGVAQKGAEDEYLEVQDLAVDLNIKHVLMSVHKIFNNNRILTEATNLFLRENGHEVLRHMMPQLKRKLSTLFSEVANRLLSNVPTRVFLKEA